MNSVFVYAFFVQAWQYLYICSLFHSHFRSFARSTMHPSLTLTLSIFASASSVELQMYTVRTVCVHWTHFIALCAKKNYPLFWHFPGHVTQCFVVGLHVVVKMREKKSKIKYQAIIYIIRALSGIHKSRQNGNIWFKAPRGWSVSKTDRECSAQTINANIVNDEIKFLHKSP